MDKNKNRPVLAAIHRSQVAARTVVCALLIFLLNAAWAQTTVTFVARGSEADFSKVLKAQKPSISLGHAFMIVTTHTSSGVKEDVFGFYPKNGSGLVKGPGMLQSEFRCGDNDDCGTFKNSDLLSRMSKVEESVTIEISDAERQILFERINSWNSGREYQITARNCEDFISEVADALGYPRPDNTLQSPVEYLRQLRVLIGTERQVRALQAKADEAQRRQQRAQDAARRAERERRNEEARAEQARQRRLAEERAAAAAAQARQSAQQARSSGPPSDWIRCNCPQAHYLAGSLFNGVRYHEEKLQCP